MSQQKFGAKYYAQIVKASSLALGGVACRNVRNVGSKKSKEDPMCNVQALIATPNILRSRSASVFGFRQTFTNEKGDKLSKKASARGGQQSPALSISHLVF